MRNRANVMLCAGLAGAAAVAAIAMSGGRVQADDPNSAPNPYHVVDNWAKLPEGRRWGMAIGVDIDRDGTSVWVFDRCGGKTCAGSNIAPIQKFDASGRLVVSFGSGCSAGRTACLLHPTARSGLPTARSRSSCN